MINRKGCGRRRLWTNLRRYPPILLEGLRKATKHHGSRAGTSEMQSRGATLLTTVLVAYRSAGTRFM
jgi:hypothetical protein